MCTVAEEHITQAHLQDRVKTCVGDFFVDPLPQADFFALGRILHDWNEEKIRFLVRKCFESLPRRGGLLICEKLLNEGKDGPVSAALQSLNMLVITEGRERTASEYETLLQAAVSVKLRKNRKVPDVLAIKGWASPSSRFRQVGQNPYSIRNPKSEIRNFPRLPARLEHRQTFGHAHHRFGFVYSYSNAT